MFAVKAHMLQEAKFRELFTKGKDSLHNLI